VSGFLSQFFCQPPRVLTLIFFLLPSLHAFSEAGSYVLKTYSPKAYLASPQNWTSLEDKRGIMYFGNTDGLLEFDGVVWRRISLPEAKAVRSLALSESGTIYVGGQNELGYLAPDSNGATRYISLLDKLDPTERKFGDVWSIVNTPAGIYFSTTERLILYNPTNGVRIWKLGGRFRRAFLIGGVLHVSISGLGLHRLVNEKLELAPGGEAFSKIDVRGLFQSSSGLTLATNKGFFKATSTGYEEIRFPISKTVLDAALYTVTQINANLIALGTTRGGLFLCDSAGEQIALLDKATGLPSDYVAGITMDQQGGVWLATGNGLARFTPRLSYFSEANGLRGAILSMARWRQILYVGTTSGLFQLKATGDGGVPRFETVADIEDSVWSLNPREDSLWIGSQRGLFQFDGKKLEARSPVADVVYDVSFSKTNPNTLFAAMRSLAYVLKFDGKSWVKAGEIPASGEEFRTIADDEQGIVWATTRSSIVRADLSSTPPNIRTYNEKDGLPKGWKNLFRIGSRLLFATEAGLLKFDGGAQKFVPDPSLGKGFSDGSKGILLLKEDPRNGSIWIAGTGYHGLLTRPGQKDAEWKAMPFVAAGFEDLWVIQPDSDGITWAASSDGRLGRLEPGLDSTNQRNLEVLIRRLMTSDTRQSIAEGNANNTVTITPSQNNLRVEFAAPFFDAPERVEYQVSLDSPLTDAMPWSNEAWKDLSNLWEGTYKLRVRARSPYGQMSPESSIALQVLPPWYRSWWAYSLYALLSSGIVFGVFRWRLRNLRESNRRLEQIVEERTTEIREQRDQIADQEKKTEALLLNILPAPVAEELRTKGSVSPMHFDDVTVCFTDFVGFTISSETMSSADLVAKLDEYFTEFDKIITAYGLEKLKTIGDSYMFVSGLPTEKADHAYLAVRAALDIVAKAQELGEKNVGLNWRLRVGLHSGPVVAGVVGLKKFAFDIWGDTVNLASRMESSGAPNRVNLSEKTYLKVADKIHCESRGLVKTKDGRDLPMYFANR
jgi:class 3 adenylate cyclase